MPALHNVRRWRGKGPSAFATDVPLHRQVYIDLRASAVDIVNAVRSSCLAVCVNGGTAAETALSVSVVLLMAGEQ